MFVPVDYKSFKTIMDDMKFEEISIKGTYERVWKFKINDRFDIRVYSTIKINSDKCRENGTDAIRCLVYDNVSEKILRLERRVHRTISALINVRLRCRELYKYVKKNPCSCGGVLIERISGTNHHFKGCSNFPVCTNNKNIIESQLKLKI